MAPDAADAGDAGDAVLGPDLQAEDDPVWLAALEEAIGDCGPTPPPPPGAACGPGGSEPDLGPLPAPED